MEAAIREAGLESDDVWPPELLAELAPLVERPNEISAEAVERFLGMSPEEMDALLAMEYRMGSFLPEFKFVHQSDRSTWKMATHALARHPVDVAAIYFTGIDTVSHLFWHFTFPEEFPDHSVSAEDRRRFGRVIALYYETVDDLIGRTLESLGGDPTVIVVSDHGFGGTGKLPWSGGHGKITPGAPIAPAGVFVMSGPGVAAAGRLPKAHVLDVTPTLLHLMGLPASREMLGRVLVDALEPELRDELPRIESWEAVGGPRIVAEVPRDPAGDAERLERLRALGYVQ
jgi:predicted AlkP superfamily phosphohydrolase/phosphomutase